MPTQANGGLEWATLGSPDGLDPSVYFQVGGRARLLWRDVDATLNFSWVNEMVLEMGNMLEEGAIETQPNPVEQNQVLMHLSHIADMGDYRKVEDLCQQTHGQKLAHPRHPGAVDLYEVNCPRLHEVLEQDTIRDMLSRCDLDGAY
jgi:hypothetical protein